MTDRAPLDFCISLGSGRRQCPATEEDRAIFDRHLRRHGRRQDDRGEYFDLSVLSDIIHADNADYRQINARHLSYYGLRPAQDFEWYLADQSCLANDQYRQVLDTHYYAVQTARSAA